MVASTDHKNHYVGTQRTINLGANGKRDGMWRRLEDMLIRFATPGARIDVILLHGEHDRPRVVATIKKKPETRFQAPGCTLETKSGVGISPLMEQPLKFLDETWLVDWEEARD